MEQLNVRRARISAAERYQGTGKAEKASAAGKAEQPQPAKTGQTADLVSETLQKLMGRIDRAGEQAKEGRRTLRAGEAALAEVEQVLERMEEAAQRAAGGGSVDRAVLQGELERLRGEIDRIVQSGVRDGLFRDGEGPEAADAALVDALLNGLEAQREGARSLPAWLLKGMAGPAPDRAALLAALGADAASGSGALLEALGSLPLEDSAAGYLAGLYLGAVISGGVPSGAADPGRAAQGLNRLLELVSEGVSPDEALELLTGGIFSGFDDFEAQFTGGTAPGLEEFLSGLLLSGGEEQIESLLLAGGGGGGFDLLMDLLLAVESSGEGPALPGGGTAPDGGGTQEGAALQWESARMGTVLASGRDLSGVSADPVDGTVTAGGTGDLILRGQGREAAEVRLTGSGTVTLQRTNTLLSVETDRARVVLAGENTLEELTLGERTVLILEGGGLTRIGALRGGSGSVLRLDGGAFVLGETWERPDGGAAPAVVIGGPVSLTAAADAAVYNPQGERLSALDIVWKAMLPGWSNITSLMVDGKQRQLALTERDEPGFLRLWLSRGNENQGFPAHSILLQGRDQAGNLRVRYAFVRWDQRTKTFQEITMYPNPFTVTGGEAGTDWRYEEESQTLCILTARVTAVSGGMGIDGDEQPFSGRLALDDGIGRVELTLEGVECRVSAGRAFRLGRENDVTLLLQSGSDNIFESGPGFAGISLGPGTSLCVDRARDAGGGPEGKLTARGGSGGAGIGRDSGVGRERCGTILIRGGDVTAAGAGGGAGIGGALGAKAGDISILGGTVTVRSACAAAIGAGIQGSCGDITISGLARVARSKGDIGGCLFGSCGTLRMPSFAETDGAELWNQKGISLQVGESTLTVPRFRVSACALRLDTVNLTSRETAQAALAVLTASRRWVGRLRGAYEMMHAQLTRSAGGLYSAQRYTGVVREDRIADLLLRDARQTLRQDPLAPYRMRAMENVGLLLR